MPTNFELEWLKPKLDIFKIHENRVHELTDSNVSPSLARQYYCNDAVHVAVAWVGPDHREIQKMSKCKTRLNYV